MKKSYNNCLDLFSYFGLNHSSFNRLQNYFEFLSAILEGKAGGQVKKYKIFSKIFEHFHFNADGRCIIPIERPSDSDTVYKEYRTLIRDFIITTDIPEGFSFDVLNYDVYNSQRITIGKQTIKLTKYLKKYGFKQFDELEKIISRKGKCQDKYFLIISINPIDFLFCSTNQGFTSCLNMKSDYCQYGYYVGLPNAIIDYNRVLFFLSEYPEPTKEFTVNDCTFNHFKVLSRSWGMLQKDGSLYFVKNYGGMDLFPLLEKEGFNVTHDQSIGLYSWKPLLCDNGKANTIYSDCCMYCTSDKIKHGTGPSRWASVAYYNFEKNIYDLIEKGGLDQWYSGNCCPNCNNDAVDEDDIIWIDGEGYCNDCVFEHFSYCDRCNEWFNADDIYIKNGSTYCSDCYHALYFYCDCCCHDYSNDDCMMNNNGEAFCRDCYSDKYTHCNECSEEILIEDCNIIDNEHYCNDCFNTYEENEAIVYCNRCNEHTFTKKATTTVINGIEKTYCHYCLDYLIRREKYCCHVCGYWTNERKGLMENHYCCNTCYDTLKDAVDNRQLPVYRRRIKYNLHILQHFVGSALEYMQQNR